jgi:hypothetical protein
VVGWDALEPVDTIGVGDGVGCSVVTCSEERAVGACVSEAIVTVGSDEDPTIVSVSVGCSDEDTVPAIVDVCGGEGLCTVKFPACEGTNDGFAVGRMVGDAVTKPSAVGDNVEVELVNVALGDKEKVLGADSDGADGCPEDKTAGGLVVAPSMLVGEGGAIGNGGTGCWTMQ